MVIKVDFMVREENPQTSERNHHSVQINLEDIDVSLSSDPAIAEYRFILPLSAWVHLCLQTWAFIDICEWCCPIAAMHKGKDVIRATCRFQHPVKPMHGARFHFLSTSCVVPFKNAASFSQMTAQFHVDFKELVRLKKRKDSVIAMGKSENYLSLS